MELKPGYKQTEVGVIPEDWNVSTVGEEFHIQLGKMLDAEKNIGTPKPFLGNRAVQWGWIDLTDIGFIKLTPSDLSRFRLRDGDLLVCEGGEVGRSAIWRQPLGEYYYQKALHRLRPKKGFNVTFMQNLLHKYSEEGALRNYVTQTSIAHLPKDKFETLPVPAPSPVEQQAIAETLSDADALIESLEQLLTKKRQIKLGARQELLTGQRRLPGFTGEWKTRLLGGMCSVKTGSKNNEDKRDDGDYPFFVRSATIERINSYSHECEAILVPGEGNIGNIFHYVKGRFNVHQRVYAITQFTPDVSGKYVYLYMTEKFGQHALQNSVKATVDSLRLPTFLGFEVKLPATLGEQVAIAELLTVMNSEITTLETQLQKARLIKQGMMQELLTGRIRLV